MEARRRDTQARQAKFPYPHLALSVVSIGFMAFRARWGRRKAGGGNKYATDGLRQQDEALGRRARPEEGADMVMGKPGMP